MESLFVNKLKYAFSYALKNNFAILNLVKTILTSITFDSFTRKIKNPCLTIKKIYLQGVCNMKHTKNILKSLLITVMALSLLAVSCKKDEEGGKPTEPTSVTLDAVTLTAAIQAAGTAAQLTGVTIDFSALTPASGNAKADAKV